jgi:RNA polymerase sigma-70 factor (ECF subfamily)
MPHAPCPIPSATAGDLDDAVVDFARARPRLRAIAHRILGDWTEAEDTVQDAWLRWQSCDRTVVQNPTAFLVTTTTRLALNAAQSARARRETAVARWTPEPVSADGDPAPAAERLEALDAALLLLAQKLSPSERAAYVLRQAFDYPYARIAEILRLSEANARQLVSRGGKHALGDRRRPPSSGDHHDHHLASAFLAAARHGDVDALERALVAAV